MEENVNQKDKEKVEEEMIEQLSELISQGFGI